MNNNLEQAREFRKIASLKFLYEVNCDGTKIRNARSKRCLKCHKHSHNSDTEYWYTQANIGGKIHKVYLHKVVAECWLGKQPAGYEIDHIDRNSLNNHYTNLRYVTRSENNLHRVMKWKKPVRIVGVGETMTFETMQACAEYISAKYGKSYKTIRGKLAKHRHRIFEYDVEYLGCAETGRGDQEKGKEQSTRVYLTGNLNTWNDAKQSEERDRVKHEVEG